MKIKEYKCGCGHDEFFFADKGNQKGIYCSYCGKWLKWADKDEQNLRMKQVSVLDKIREEFISLYPKNYAGELELGGASCAFSLNKVLNIIDKYKASPTEVKESEG